MCTSPARIVSPIAVVSALAWASVPAFACSIPVFQYALEYWEPDAFEFVVLHRGPLADEEQAVVDRLKRDSWDDVGYCNHTVRVVDLDEEPDDGMRELWAGQATSELPCVVVLHPRGPRPGVVAPSARQFWSGPLTAKAADILLRSPGRQAIANRLRQGQAAVWVVLESGDRVKDDAVCESLKGFLDEAALGLTLPVLPGDAAAEAQPKITFSVVRVSRSDPVEQILVGALLDCEPDLRKYPSDPMAFPVFGRGRALYALVGKGITEDNVFDACSFLAGACSCIVKWQNPGVDLLITADWTTPFSPDEARESSLSTTQPNASSAESGTAFRFTFARQPKSPPPATQPSSLAAVQEKKTDKPEPGDDEPRSLLRNSLLGIAGGIVVIAAVALILAARDRSSSKNKL